MKKIRQRGESMKNITVGVGIGLLLQLKLQSLLLVVV